SPQASTGPAAATAAAPRAARPLVPQSPAFPRRYDSMRPRTPMSLIGTLAEIKIADVLRLFSSGKKSGVLTITDGGHQGVVRFQKGNIVHAMAGRLHGEEALVDLFGWKTGQLTFVPEERSVTPNIVKDVDALILEGLRMGEILHRQRELVP